jgi:hypothetical protein
LSNIKTASITQLPEAAIGKTEMMGHFMDQGFFYLFYYFPSVSAYAEDRTTEKDDPMRQDGQGAKGALLNPGNALVKAQEVPREDNPQFVQYLRVGFFLHKNLHVFQGLQEIIRYLPDGLGGHLFKFIHGDVEGTHSGWRFT